MSTEQLQVIAGMGSTLLFISSSFPMLYKAFRTREMGSYSLEQIMLSNVGNLVYWLYVAGLPVGPVWLLHGFHTISTGLMFIFYLRYEKGWGRPLPSTSAESSGLRRDVRLTLEWPAQPAYSVTSASRRTNV